MNKAGPQPIDLEGYEPPQQVHNWEMIFPPPVQEPAIPQDLDPNVLQEVQQVRPLGFQMNLTGEGYVTRDVIQMFDYPEFIHGLSQIQLNEIYAEVTNRREAYFHHYYPNHTNTFSDFIINSIESPYYDWCVFYFLLIYTRVIDELIHELYDRFDVNDGIHLEVNEGIRLCNWLNTIEGNMNINRRNRFQPLIDSVERIRDHFQQRNQYYPAVDLPDNNKNIVENVELNIAIDPNPNPSPPGPIQPPNIRPPPGVIRPVIQWLGQPNIVGPQIPGPNAPQPPMVVRPVRPPPGVIRPVIQWLGQPNIVGPQIPGPNVPPPPMVVVPIRPPLIGPNPPPALPVQGELVIGVDDMHPNYPHSPLIQQWGVLNQISNTPIYAVNVAYHNLVGQRQDYFEELFPFGGDFGNYIIDAINPTEPIHFWQLYFLLIYTRLMDEIVCRGAELTHWPVWIGRRDHNVIVGIRLVQRLIPIINGWGFQIQEDHQVIIQFVTDMRQHFEFRRQTFNIANP